MKALLCKSLGLPDSLVFEDVPDPVPGPGQVLIEMKAAGVISRTCWSSRASTSSSRHWPFAPGSELAGVVLAVAKGAQRQGRRPGDCVGLTRCVCRESRRPGATQLIRCRTESTSNRRSVHAHLRHFLPRHQGPRGAQARRNHAGAGRCGRRRYRSHPDRQGAWGTRDRCRLDAREARHLPREPGPTRRSTTPPKTCASASRR